MPRPIIRPIMEALRRAWPHLRLRQLLESDRPRQVRRYERKSE